MEKQSTNKKASLFNIVLIAVIVLMIALFAFTVKNKKRITSLNREYLVDNAVRMADSIDSALSDGYDNIKILSELVSRSLTGPEFDIADIQELIQNSVFDFMEFADKDGMDHNITGGISDARDRKYYLDAKEGNTGMELIHVSRATHETLLMFYSPIYYEDEFVGSLVGVYQAANRITRLLTAQYFNESATSYLATSEGRVIASNQGFDPQNEMYVSDLAEGDDGLRALLEASIESGETITFELGKNTTGGCMVKLPENGGYLVHIFPKQANDRMISSANILGYGLVAFLMILFLAILLWLVHFYREQQKLVENARNQAEIANNAKTSFLFNMSHDIRTPMNAITGFTDKAIKNQDNPEILNSSLEKVQSSSKYLLRIVNNILDMAKIESGKLELNEEINYSREGAEEMLGIFTADAARKGIVLHSEFKDIRNEYIYSDESRYGQILANLLSNAIKYTNNGGDIWYTVEEIPSGKAGYARFVSTVRDSGKGMSPEFLSRIFDEFEREQTATQSGEQGTGLGMAIVKKLVDNMGGSIDIQSEPGTGTTVTVITEHRIPTDEEIEQYKENRKKLDAEYEKNFKGKRILLVEDNELNREIAQDILEEKGFIVDTAEDGDIAVEMIQAMVDREDYDYYVAVLMDVQMPRMDGYEATRQIREIKAPAGKHLPIIAMTANAFEEDRQNALACGMDAHVAKPIDLRILWKTLSKFA